MKRIFYSTLFKFLLLSLLSCNGGSGGGVDTPPKAPDIDNSASLTVKLLEDPTPSNNELYGLEVTALSSGNVLVTDKNDDSIATNAGAFHLFNPQTGSLIASYYGDDANDRYGESGKTHDLKNGNAVLVIEKDDVAGVTNAGSVLLVNATTGAIIKKISGDNPDDSLGENGITVLQNGNFVIATNNDDIGGISNAGSARLINGITGDEIAAVLGDEALDKVPSLILELKNGNIVIGAEDDNPAGVSNAGSVTLLDGETGAVLAVIEGNNINDRFPSELVALKNGHFVLVASDDDTDGLINNGSVRLVNGNNGNIKKKIKGTTANDELGSSGIFELTSFAFVIVSKSEDFNGVVDSGTARFVQSDTGLILSVVSRDSAPGFDNASGLGNFENLVAIPSPVESVAGNANAGNVRFYDKTTYAEVASYAGDEAGDSVGSAGVYELQNENVVILSPEESSGGLSDIGSVRLVDGGNGSLIKNIKGNDASDSLSESGILLLSNGNFVVLSQNESESGVLRVGSIRLINGGSGDLITAFLGVESHDNVGRGTSEAFKNNTFIVTSNNENRAGITNAGVIRHVNGSSGALIQEIVGKTTNDFNSTSFAEVENGFIVATPFYDHKENVNSGRVQFIPFK